MKYSLSLLQILLFSFVPSLSKAGIPESSLTARPTCNAVLSQPELENPIAPSDQFYFFRNGLNRTDPQVEAKIIYQWILEHQRRPSILRSGDRFEVQLAQRSLDLFLEKKTRSIYQAIEDKLRDLQKHEQFPTVDVKEGRAQNMRAWKAFLNTLGPKDKELFAPGDDYPGITPKRKDQAAKLFSQFLETGRYEANKFNKFFEDENSPQKFFLMNEMLWAAETILQKEDAFLTQHAGDLESLISKADNVVVAENRQRGPSKEQLMKEQQREMQRKQLERLEQKRISDLRAKSQAEALALIRKQKNDEALALAAIKKAEAESLKLETAQILKTAVERKQENEKSLMPVVYPRVRSNTVIDDPEKYLDLSDYMTGGLQYEDTFAKYFEKNLTGKPIQEQINQLELEGKVMPGSSRRLARYLSDLNSEVDRDIPPMLTFENVRDPKFTERTFHYQVNGKGFSRTVTFEPAAWEALYRAEDHTISKFLLSLENFRVYERNGRKFRMLADQESGSAVESIFEILINQHGHARLFGCVNGNVHRILIYDPHAPTSKQGFANRYRRLCARVR